MEQELNKLMDFSSGNLSITEFIINLVLTALLTIILKLVYQKYGYSLSNRNQFGRNFLMMAMTTMLIITVVKSSLALSLGLVGALSVIRFRNAIKEPEELGYLFLAISIGLGMGANQVLITVVAITIILLMIVLVSLFSSKFENNQNLYITIQSDNPQKINVEQIIEILTIYCDEVNLRRIDETIEVMEVSFLVKSEDFEKINHAKNELQKIQSDLKFTFLDNKESI